MTLHQKHPSRMGKDSGDSILEITGKEIFSLKLLIEQ